MNFSVRLIALIFGNCIAVGCGLLVYNFFPDKTIALVCGFLVLASVTGLSYYSLGSPLDRFLKTLEAALLHLKDGELSLQLPPQTDTRFNHIGQLFNQVITNLRQEQIHLLQRDLMLNRVFETVSSALLLTDARDKIVLCNPAARQLLNQGKAVRGLALAELANQFPPSLMESIRQQQSLMFTLENADAEPESWYLFCERFQLHGYEHCLYHFQPLTQALARTEVDTWKKVIRVFSHELNNSLAPVSSLAHSGLQLVERSTLATNEKELLERILTTVQERATHLRDFLSEYAQFSRLPTPAREPIDWLAFFTKLQALATFACDTSHAQRQGFADPVQLSQVLINLIKNAQEAGASRHGIQITIKAQGTWDLLLINDDGSGMSEEQLKQATLPFYSTKRDGSGLGLALCREIIEAHNGRITFANNPDKGLKVSIWLPAGTNK